MLKAGIDDEWVYVPDKTARKNKVVQCNEEDIDAEIDEGCVGDLKKKKCVKRTAFELEESELATPEGGKKKRRGWCFGSVVVLGLWRWCGLALARSLRSSRLHRAGLHLALRPMGRWWHCRSARNIARQSAALPLSTLHCHHAVEKCYRTSHRHYQRHCR